MSTIAEEISRIQTNVTDSLNAVSTYGVSVASDASSDDLASLILAIPTISIPVPISQGGTEATTAEAARSNLGAASQTEVDELKATIAALTARIADLETRTTFQPVTQQ